MRKIKKGLILIFISIIYFVFFVGCPNPDSTDQTFSKITVKYYVDTLKQGNLKYGFVQFSGNKYIEWMDVEGFKFPEFVENITTSPYSDYKECVIENVPDGEYWIKFFIDSDLDQIMDENEAWGEFYVNVDSNVTKEYSYMVYVTAVHGPDQFEPNDSLGNYGIELNKLYELSLYKSNNDDGSGDEDYFEINVDTSKIYMVISISNFSKGIDFDVDVYDDNFFPLLVHKEIINDRNVIFKFDTSSIGAIPKAYIGIKATNQPVTGTYILKVYGSDQ